MNELLITLPFSLIKSIESFVNFVAKTYLKNQCPLYEVKPMLKVIQIRNLETTTQNIREEIHASVLEAINLECKLQLVNNVSTTNVILLLRPTCFQCSEIIRHLSIKLNKKLPDSFKLPRHITEEKSFSFSFLDLTLVTGEQEWVLHNVSESENKQISLLKWTPKQEVESKKDQLRTQRVQLNNERRTEGSVPSVPSLSWDPYDVGRRFLSDDSSLPAVDVNPASSSLGDRTPKVPEPLGHLNKEALNRNLEQIDTLLSGISIEERTRILSVLLDKNKADSIKTPLSVTTASSSGSSVSGVASTATTDGATGGTHVPSKSAAATAATATAILRLPAMETHIRDITKALKETNKERATLTERLHKQIDKSLSPEKAKRFKEVELEMAKTLKDGEVDMSVEAHEETGASSEKTSEELGAKPKKTSGEHIQVDSDSDDSQDSVLEIDQSAIIASCLQSKEVVYDNLDEDLVSSQPATATTQDYDLITGQPNDIVITLNLINNRSNIATHHYNITREMANTYCHATFNSTMLKFRVSPESQESFHLPTLLLRAIYNDAMKKSESLFKCDLFYDSDMHICRVPMKDKKQKTRTISETSFFMNKPKRRSTRLQTSHARTWAFRIQDSSTLTAEQASAQYNSLKNHLMDNTLLATHRLEFLRCLDGKILSEADVQELEKLLSKE